MSETREILTLQPYIHHGSNVFKNCQTFITSNKLTMKIEYHVCRLLQKRYVIYSLQPLSFLHVNMRNQNRILIQEHLASKMTTCEKFDEQSCTSL